MSTLTLDPTHLHTTEQKHTRSVAAGLQSHTTHVTLNVQGETFEVPPVLARAFLQITEALVRGQRVSIATEEEELTTTEAADLLNVSRPHLVKLLKQGDIPFHTAGSHRRVYREDVLEYKKKQREEAEEAMQELAKQAQELDMGC